MKNKLEPKKETINAELISSLVLNGDIGKMSDKMKVEYYNQLCHSLNLNPVTRPFQMISFQGKSVLYATKDATEQLRKLNGVSVVELNQEIKDGLCISKCKVQDSSNRFDIATGVTVTAGLKGGDLANSIMKSETKAKRRATLSICGLGMLDESELDTMPKYETSDISQIKTETKSEVKSVESVKTDFKTRVMNYFSTLTDKDSLIKAFAEAKTRPAYKELSFQDEMQIEDAYSLRLKSFEPEPEPEEITTKDLVEENIQEVFEVTEVEVTEVEVKKGKKTK